MNLWLSFAAGIVVGIAIIIILLSIDNDDYENYDYTENFFD